MAGDSVRRDLWRVLVMRDDRQERRVSDVRDALICGFGLKVAFHVATSCLRS